MSFGDKVRQIRKEKQLTQQELAQQLGISRRALSSYENNSSRPRSIESYRRLAKILGVNVNFLLRDEYMGDVDVQRFKEDAALLFSGGQLSEQAMDELMLSIHETYLWAKRQKRKKGKD